MKQDRKRISKERHEIAYIRHLAREILLDTNEIELHDKVMVPNFRLRRICKALIKYTNGYTKRKK